MFKTMSYFVGFGCAVLMALATGSAATLEELAQPPSLESASISETGRYVAVATQNESGEGSILTVYNYDGWSAPKARAIPFRKLQIQDMVWKGDDRLIVRFMRGVAVHGWMDDPEGNVIRSIAMDPDGSNPVELLGDSRWFWRVNTDPPVVSILTGDPDHVLMSGGSSLPLGLYKINVRTGESELVERGVGSAAAGTVTVRWDAAPDGRVHLRYDVRRNAQTVALSSRPPAATEWTRIAEMPLDGGNILGFQPAGLAPDGQSFYAVGRFGRDKLGAYRLSLADASVQERLFEHPTLDLGPGELFWCPTASYLLVNDYTGAINGFHILEDRPQTRFLNPNWAKANQLVQESMPDQAVEIIGHARDFGRVLFLAFGENQPGTVHLMDVRTATLWPLMSTLPRLDGEPFGPTRAISV